MIQTTLSFILGFLCAAFLALLVAPAIWRRAVVLTRRRVEASLPLTMDQIQADKDRQRAEFAMSARKLEISVKSLKEKAAGQAVEIGRIREELALAREESEGKSTAIAGLEARADQMRAGLDSGKAELDLAEEKIARQEKLAGERALELEKLGRMYDEASFSASSRQIEIAAQEAKVEELAGDLAMSRNEHKQAEARAREAVAENKSLRETLRASEKELKLVSGRLGEQETLADERGREIERLGRLYDEANFNASSRAAELAAREAKLEKVSSDAATLREERKKADTTLRETGAQNKTLREALKAEERKASALERKVDKLIASSAELEEKLERRERELGRLREQQKSQPAAPAPVADHARLQDRLQTLTRENRKLREALGSQQGGGKDAESEGEALLRAQIGDLAAEVVHLTSKLDGSDKELRTSLAGAPRGQENGQPSLADRIRALQDVASSR